jgi:tetratricopeptide (TPR) repeat protein
VGVAAYLAEDYAEAARELRAYRRMSGDETYRAVLADCERALGRPEVALRLVSEAVATNPDDEEMVELHLVEAGARRDLGEAPAARLVLEGALGGRPMPDTLGEADAGRLRLAAAYADLLQEQGEEALAADWFTAIAAADPEDLVGAVGRLGIEFTELEEAELEEAELDAAEDDAAEDDAAEEAELEEAEDDAAEDDGDQEASGDAELSVATVTDPVDDLPDDSAEDVGPEFDEDVEAEVAELLGEIDPPATENGSQQR